jgi:hypothetical protein
MGFGGFYHDPNVGVNSPWLLLPGLVGGGDTWGTGFLLLIMEGV